MTWLAQFTHVHWHNPAGDHVIACGIPLEQAQPPNPDSVTCLWCKRLASLAGVVVP